MSKPPFTFDEDSGLSWVALAGMLALVLVPIVAYLTDIH